MSDMTAPALGCADEYGIAAAAKTRSRTHSTPREGVFSDAFVCSSDARLTRISAPWLHSIPCRLLRGPIDDCERAVRQTSARKPIDAESQNWRLRHLQTE